MPVAATGRSPLAKTRKVGAAAEPVVGPAKTVAAVWVSSVLVIVATPAEVTDELNAIGVESVKTKLWTPACWFQVLPSQT